MTNNLKKIASQIKKWKESPIEFSSGLLKVQTKDNQRVPFYFNDFQQQRNDLRYWRKKHQKPARWIICKDRKIGESTGTSGFIFRRSLQEEDMMSVILGNVWDTTDLLHDIYERFINQFPAFAWLLFKTNKPEPQGKSGKINRYEIEFDRKKYNKEPSRIEFKTAKTTTTGIGKTPFNVHSSETARYGKDVVLFTNLLNSVPKTHHTDVTIESVANSFGNFFEITYNEALKTARNKMRSNHFRGKHEYDFSPLIIENKWGALDFFPFFFPAHKNIDNRLPLDCTPDEFCETLDGDEKEIIRSFFNNTFDVDALTFMQWRRDVWKNECERSWAMFNEQHPLTPELAFQQSVGTSVYPQDMVAIRLKETRELIDGKFDENGTLIKQPIMKRVKLEWSKDGFPILDQRTGKCKNKRALRVIAKKWRSGDLEPFVEVLCPPGFEVNLISGEITKTETSFKHRYAGGSDHAFGLHYGNFDVGMIGDKMQDMVVAMLRGRFGPALFAEELMKLLVWYDYADHLAARKGSGETCIELMLKTYPKLMKGVSYRKGLPEDTEIFGLEETSYSNIIIHPRLRIKLIARPGFIQHEQFWIESKTFIEVSHNKWEAIGKKSNPNEEDPFQDDCMDAAAIVNLAMENSPIISEVALPSLREIFYTQNKRISLDSL